MDMASNVNILDGVGKPKLFNEIKYMNCMCSNSKNSKIMTQLFSQRRFVAT